MPKRKQEPDPNRIGGMRPLPDDLMERVRTLALRMGMMPVDAVEYLVRVGLVAHHQKLFEIEIERYNDWMESKVRETIEAKI